MDQLESNVRRKLMLAKVAFVDAEKALAENDPLRAHTHWPVLAGQCARSAGLPTDEAGWLNGRDPFPAVIVMLRDFPTHQWTAEAVMEVVEVVRQKEIIH